MDKFLDADCIWNNVSDPISTEFNNLVDACHFNHVVIRKVLLPKGNARKYVNGHARYALYKILKSIQINPAYSGSFYSSLWREEHETYPLDR